MEYKNKIKYFDCIPALPKREIILSRLGYRRDTTILDTVQTRLLEEGIKKGLSLCEPVGAYERFNILSRNSQGVSLEGGIALYSSSLAKLLDKSNEVLLMAATAGKPVVEEISRQVECGDAALGIIMDSAASQAADAAVGWIMDFVNKLVRREGKKLTRHRYSPGFGDLELSNQKVIFDVLSLERLGMGITESYMLIPEKSVIAIAGIEEFDAKCQGINFI